MFAICMALAAAGHLRVALSVITAHHCYLRPGESAGVLLSRIFPSGAGASTGQLASILLHPVENRKSSKTREFDESIIVDWPWLAQRLLQLRRARRAHGSQTIAGVPQVTIARVFKVAASSLGLDQLFGMAQLYRLRHSGPSADMALKRRDVASIKLRGRWKTDSTMRRYTKGGRVDEQMARCSPLLRDFCKRSTALLPSVLSGSRGALRPPALA